MGLSCKLCEKEFASRFNLARHVRTAHQQASGPLGPGLHVNLNHTGNAEKAAESHPPSPASVAGSMETEASHDSADTAGGQQPAAQTEEDDTDDQKASSTDSDTDQDADSTMDDDGDDKSEDEDQQKFDIFGRVPKGEKMVTDDYPWHEVKDEIAEMYDERIQRRKQTYIAEGYTEEEALSEAYYDFKDKFLLAAKHLVFLEISKHASLDGDETFNELEELKSKIYDKHVIKEEYAWKRAIRMKEHLLIPMIPRLEDFKEEDEQMMDE